MGPPQQIYRLQPDSELGRGETPSQTGARHQGPAPRGPGTEPARPDGAGPMVIKIVIIVLTLAGMILAVRACNRSSPPESETENTEQPAPSGTGGAQAATGEEGTNATVTGAEPGASTGTGADSAGSGAPQGAPADVGPKSGGASPQPSSAGAGVADGSIPQEMREAARQARPPDGLSDQPTTDAVSVFEALLRETLWEARTLHAMAVPYMSAEDRSTAEAWERRIDIAKGFGPHYEDAITLSARLSADSACHLIAGLATSRAVAAKVLACRPDDNDPFRVGYPAVLGHYSELQVRAWCLLLRESGAGGLSLAQRLEAELSSLPPGPSIDRSMAAMNLLVQTLAGVGQTMKKWNASRSTLAAIENTMQNDLRSARGVFPRCLILTRGRAASLRHLATGESP